MQKETKVLCYSWVHGVTPFVFPSHGWCSVPSSSHTWCGAPHLALMPGMAPFVFLLCARWAPLVVLVRMVWRHPSRSSCAWCSLPRRPRTWYGAPRLPLARTLWRPSSSSCAHGERPLQSLRVWCVATPRGPRTHGAASLVVLTYGMAPLVFPSRICCGAPRLPLVRTLWHPSSSPHAHPVVRPLIFPSCARCGANPRGPRTHGVTSLVLTRMVRRPSSSLCTQCGASQAHGTSCMQTMPVVGAVPILAKGAVSVMLNSKTEYAIAAIHDSLGPKATIR